MFKRSCSLFALIAGALLLIGTAFADSKFYSGAISGEARTQQVYTVGAAISDKSGVWGWMYFGLANGSWVDSTPLALTVAANGDTQAMFGGYVNDVSLCYVFLSTSGIGPDARVSVQIVEPGVGTLLDSVNGDIVYGAILSL